MPSVIPLIPLILLTQLAPSSSSRRALLAQLPPVAIKAIEWVLSEAPPHADPPQVVDPPHVEPPPRQDGVVGLKVSCPSSFMSLQYCPAPRLDGRALLGRHPPLRENPLATDITGGGGREGERDLPSTLL